MNKKILWVTVLILIASFCAGCGQTVTTGEIGVVKNEEFSGVYVDLTIAGFNDLGFAFGDSVDIEFDNGLKFQDVPYYSGYYSPVGELLVCGYPGYPHVIIARNYGDSTWEEFGMTEDSRVTVTLNKKGKYKANQDLFSLEYSEALAEMTEHEGPVLVHCVEGKDRTGFVCTLLLALAEASPREIVDDYMITYDNYYKVTKEKDPEKYEAILGNVYDFLYCLCGAEKGADLNTLDLKAGAENYLRRGGLSDAQIETIEAYLCGSMD